MQWVLCDCIRGETASTTEFVTQIYGNCVLFSPKEAWQMISFVLLRRNEAEDSMTK